MGLFVGGTPVKKVYVGSNPVQSVYVGSQKVWSAVKEVVQITLDTDLQARDQFRAALADRGLDYQTVTKLPFDIELVGSGAMNGMFFGCAALTSVPSMDTRNVTAMRTMFEGCAALTSVPVMDTSSVTDMFAMFFGCVSLTSVPAMDTSSVTNTTAMFYNCPALTYVPDMNTSKVTNAVSMFHFCSSLTDGSVRLFGKHSQVNTTDMIANSGLTKEPFVDMVQITLGTGFNTQSRFRSALSDRGLNYQTVEELPFGIELVGTGSAEAMFRDCAALTRLPPMNTSGVTSMRSMFYDCVSLTTVPPMNTSQVTEMRYMHYGCSSLTSVYKMDTSKVTNMLSMYYECSLLKSVPDMDTSRVTEMGYMFRGCSSLTSVPDMDTSKVTNMYSMFNTCSSLTSVPDMDTTQVTDMSWMFYGCSSLTSVPAMITSNVTSMRAMFQSCSSLTTVPAMDTSKGTNMVSMFNTCSSLTYVPDLQASNVEDVTNMFRNCMSLTDGNVRLIGRHPNVDTTDMIINSSLTLEPFYDKDGLPLVQFTLGDGTEARDQFQAELTARGLSYATVTELPFAIQLVGTGSAQNMFDGCTSLTSVPDMDTSQVTNMSWMFYECSSLTSVPDLDTAQVTTMERMFSYCSSLTHVPYMDTAQVTNMKDMFSYCSSLTTAPALNTSQVTNMRGMFYLCPALTHAPALDTRQAVNMTYMFGSCSSLVHVPDMYTSQATELVSMFQHCSSLTDGNVRLLGKHPSANTTNMIFASGLTKEPFYDVVQITLATGQQVQYQLRDALTARGLNYRNVTELPFEIELVGSGETTSLFDGFSALTKVPAMDTSQVTNMQRMFYNCSSLTTVPPMDTSKVTSTYYTFYGCSALTSVPPMDTSKVTNAQYMFNRCSALTDENVRLIGKNPSVDTMNMLNNSGLTKEPFYATDRLPNPPAPRVVTISKQGFTSQWDTSSATGDVSLIQEWTGNGKARFAAYVTCNEAVYYGSSYATHNPGAVIPSGVDVEPAMRSVYTFTEVI